MVKSLLCLAAARTAAGELDWSGIQSGAAALSAVGGEIFKLSRVLRHSEMQTTQIYLRDFQSREARVDHAQFSPVERNHLGKMKRGKRAA
jgi:hypothetical protein